MNLLNLKIWLNDLSDHLFLSTCDYLQLNLVTNLEHWCLLQAPTTISIVPHLVVNQLVMLI